MKLDPELAQLIVENMSALAIFDADGRYIYVNKGWVEALRLQPEEVLGKHPKTFFPDTKIDTVISTRHPMIGEFISTKKPSIGTVAYYPIIKDDKVVAVVMYSIFPDLGVALAFKQRVSHLAHEVNYLKGELRKFRGSRYTVEDIIGHSPAMLKLKEQIFQAARSSSTVLIQGETGTGKELVAHAIHNASQRSTANLVSINCAAIPGELLEAELFGYEGGAFTGAAKGGRRGKFEMADMGSLFLDEINLLPVALQPKLLRVLQEREIDRIGGKNSIEVNVRVIAATNADLSKLVQDKKFRSDLFYRLNVMQVNIPPLRERKGDLPELVSCLLKRLNHQLGLEVKGVEPDVMSLLATYDWPGNVRELQNVLERAMNMVFGDYLTVSHFEWFLENKRKKTGTTPPPSREGDSLQDAKNSFEKEAICAVLKNCGGNKVLAAKALKISRMQLYRKMHKLGVECN